MIAGTVRINWQGARLYRRIGERTLAAMRALGEEIRDDARKEVGRQYPPSGPPGGFPARRSGRFQASIVYRTDAAAKTLRVLSQGVTYAPFLEYGTRFMAARPTFRLMMIRYRRRIARAIGSATTGGVSAS